MAARMWLKRAAKSENFSLRLLSRKLCIASSRQERTDADVSRRKKEKKKDLEKMALHEDYRHDVENMRAIFRAEYEAEKAKEVRRVEEINRGSFSPLERHKRAVEDITKYNESKERARKIRQEEKIEKKSAQLKRQKEISDAQHLKKNRELVLKVIEESYSFVTASNLEEKIQEVLSKETNYNFALTPDGKKIMSQEPPHNFGITGPGPWAYRGSGIKFPFNNGQDSWNPERKLDVIMDSTTDESESSESSDSDLSDSDDDEVGNPKR